MSNSEMAKKQEYYDVTETYYLRNKFHLIE